MSSLSWTVEIVEDIGLEQGIQAGADDLPALLFRRDGSGCAGQPSHALSARQSGTFGVTGSPV